MPTVGLLHSGKKKNFAGPVAALVRALPPGVRLDDRYAADLPGSIDQNINALADALVAAAPAAGPNYVLVAAGGPEPAQKLRDRTTTIPIVFTTVADPVDMGLVANVNAPGGNLTGMAGQTSEKDRDRLEVLFQLLRAKGKISNGDNIGVLVADHRPHKVKQVQDVQGRADHSSLRLKLRRPPGGDAKNLADIANAFAFFKDLHNNIKGVVVMADSLFNDLRKDLVGFANADPAIPTIYQWRQFVEEEGGLVSFGPDITEAYTKAGEYVTQILGGKRPATMQCSRPSGFTVYVKAATALKQLNMTSAQIPNRVTVLDGNSYPVQVI